MAQEQKKKKKAAQSTNRNYSANNTTKLTLLAFCLSKFTITIASWASSPWQIILWSEHRFAEEMGISGWLGFAYVSFVTVCVSVHVRTNVQCQLPALVLAQVWRCYQFVSVLSHPSDTCHQRYFHRRSPARFSPPRYASLLRLICLTARRLSTPPHL